MLIIVTIGFIMLLVLNSKILKNNFKVLNPVSILIVTWIVTLLMHNVYFKSNNAILYIVIFVGILSFCLGFWSFSDKYIFISSKHNFEFDKAEYNYEYIFRLIKPLTMLELVRLVYYYYIIVIRLSGSLTFFLNNTNLVRFYYLKYNFSFLENVFEFSCNSLAMIGYVLVGIYLSQKNRNGILIVIIWSAIELANAFLTISKMKFIVFILVVAIAYMNNIKGEALQWKKIRKIIPFLLLIFGTFFVIVGYQRNYMVKGDLITVVTDSTIDYFAGPTEGLKIVIDEYDGGFSLCTHTFSAITGFLKTVGVHVSHGGIIGHNGTVFTGRSETNVYTWFGPFYMDLGYIGFIVFPYLIGILVGILYSQKKKNLFIDICNAWFGALLLMSFFDYMWSQTIYVFVFVLGYIINKKLYMRLYKNE